MINYIPKQRHNPKLMTKMPSAWGDIPTILKDIIERFNVKQNKALEFGVEFGYSTSALSNYFNIVIGVDTFKGDIHTANKDYHYEMTKENLKEFNNIQLIESTYQEFIKNNNEYYDLIHIDIVHDYEPTYECGEWAIQHSDITIFHDTESFPSIKRVCEDITNKFNLDFYNYPYSHGLGILVKKII